MPSVNTVPAAFEAITAEKGSTFSTFSVETAGLLQSGKTGLAMLYTALSLLLGVTVALLGQRLVR